MTRLLGLWMLIGAAWCQVPHERPAWFSGTQPHFVNGFLHYRGPLAAQFNAALYNRQGELVFEALIETPEGDLADVLDLTAFPDGTSVAAVKLGAGTRAGLLLLDRDGAAVRFVETFPFVPRHLAVTPSGAIWTLGWEASPFQPDRPADTNFEVFRKFSREGDLLARHFRRSEFSAKSDPWEAASLHAASDKFGAYIPGVGEWLEFSHDGGLRGRWELPPLHGTPPRLVFSPAGKLYALSGGLYLFDRATEEWTLVPDFSIPASARYLGSDDKRLVFLDTTPYPPRLLWLPLP